MSNPSCLATTPKVQELLDLYPEKAPAIIKTKIEEWQRISKVDGDILPSKQELDNFITMANTDNPLDDVEFKLLTMKMQMRKGSNTENVIALAEAPTQTANPFSVPNVAETKSSENETAPAPKAAFLQYQEQMKAEALATKEAEKEAEENFMPANTIESSIADISTTKKTQLREDYTSETKAIRIAMLSNLFSEMVAEQYAKYRQDVENVAAQESDPAVQTEMISTLNKTTKGRYLTRVITPGKIMNDIYMIFRELYNADPQTQASFIFNTKVKNMGVDVSKLPEAAVQAKIKEIIENGALEKAKVEWLKIITNFEGLALEALPMIESTSGIRITKSSFTAHTDDSVDSSLTYASNENEGIAIANGNDNLAKEETGKEGWQIEAREVEQYSTLSVEIKNFLGTLRQLEYNSKGNLVRAVDDLGFAKYLDPRTAHGELQSLLYNARNVEHMLAILKKNQAYKPWLFNIINLIEGKVEVPGVDTGILVSQLFSGLRRNRIEYVAHKTKAESGIVEVFSLNEEQIIKNSKLDWISNQQLGTVISSTLSVYDKDAKVKSKEELTGLMAAMRALNVASNRLSSEAKRDPNNEIIQSILPLLESVGIVITKENFDKIIAYSDPKKPMATPNFMLLRGELNLMVKILADKRTDITADTIIGQRFNSSFNKIAALLYQVADRGVDRNFREGGKSRNSFTNPNYLMDELRDLQGYDLTDEQYLELMEEKFGYDDFLKKNGQYRNSWIKALTATKPDGTLTDRARYLRDHFNHVVVLHKDKKEYSDWTNAERTAIAMSQFFSDNNQSEHASLGYYSIPILSDVTSLEFVRFERFTSLHKDENGQTVGFVKPVIDGLVQVALQELDRINRVIARNTDSVEAHDLIENYDMTEKSLGGAEFKFLPFLNKDLAKIVEAYNSATKDDAKFLQALANKIAEGLANDFENDFKAATKDDLFESDKLGKYVQFQGRSHAADFRAASVLFKRALGDMIKQDKGTQEHRNFIDWVAKQLAENRYISEEHFNIAAELVADNLSDEAYQNIQYKHVGKEMFKEFWYNNALAQAQIIQITTTDLAFYKSLDDFQKRYKEIYSPALRLNTDATFASKIVGKKDENVMLLADEYVVSNSIEDIREVVDNNPRLSEADRADILNKFSDVCVTDAQAYRTLPSYRRVMVMAGKWNQSLEDSYNRILEGKWDAKDLDTVWTNIKPFTYSQIKKSDGKGGYIKTPIQHKNSEFLLLAAHAITGALLNKSPKLKALNEYMMKNDIDVAMFHTASKVGTTGKVNLNSLVQGENESNAAFEKRVKETLHNATHTPEGAVRTNVIQKIPYKNYGIQVSTPEHLIDHDIAMGTQIRKLIMGDFNGKGVYNINGQEMSGEEVVKLYDDIITANIEESFEQLKEVFKDNKALEKVLLAEVASNPRFSRELVEAVSLDENGNFNLPLYDTVHSARIQALVLSVIKNRVTKQKIRGGAVVQTSSYAVSDELNILFEGEGTNKRVVGIECYLPAYAKDFYSTFIDENSHTLDFSKMPDELKKLVGYRVPTEYHYSMAPLIVKGFVPQVNGSMIMLPKEITTLSGSDFDVDKLFLFLPSFRKEYKYDYKAMREAFQQEHPEVRDEVYAALKEDAVAYYDKWYEEQSDDFKMANPKDVTSKAARKAYIASVFEKTGGDPLKMSDEAKATYDKWVKANKKRFLLDVKITKINYPKDGTTGKLMDPKLVKSREARNNMLIDIIHSVLTHPDAASKLLTPGGFDYVKRGSRVTTILENPDIDSKKIEEAITEYSKKHKTPLNIARNRATNEILLYDTLSAQTLDCLNYIVGKFSVYRNPLAYSTQVYYHRQNMTGSELIGIYANSNTHNSVLQHSNAKLNPQYNFKYNGHISGPTKGAFNSIYNDKGEAVSNFISQFLAASVDNVKDTALAGLNQNVFTINVSILLSRLGYNPIEIGILLRQPIIMDVTDRYFKNEAKGDSASKAISDIAKEYLLLSGQSASKGLVKYNMKNASPFYANDLAQSLTRIAAFRNGNMTLKEYNSYIATQLQVLSLFERLSRVADDLGSLVSNSKSDTAKGAPGPDIANVYNSLQSLSDLMDRVSKPTFSIQEGLVILPSPAAISDELKESVPLSFMQAFSSYGMQAVPELLSPFFEHFNPELIYVIKQVTEMGRRNVLPADTINKIFDAFFAFKMSAIPYFSGDDTRSSYSSSIDFVTNFPLYLNSLKKNNPAVAKNKLLNSIRLVKTETEYKLVINNVGSLPQTTRDGLTGAWEELLESSDPEIQRVGFDLFRYAYMQSGLAFGPSSFGSLAPYSLRKVMPQYSEAVSKKVDSSADLHSFILQFVRNNLGMSSITYNVPSEHAGDFFNDEGTALPVVVTLSEDMDAIEIGSDPYIKRIAMDNPVPRTNIKVVDPKGNVHYYFATSARSATAKNGVTDAYSVQYVKLEGLGVNNSYVEYDMTDHYKQSIYAQNLPVDFNYLGAYIQPSSSGVMVTTQEDADIKSSTIFNDSAKFVENNQVGKPEVVEIATVDQVAEQVIEEHNKIQKAKKAREAEKSNNLFGRDDNAPENFSDDNYEDAYLTEYGEDEHFLTLETFKGGYYRETFGALEDGAKIVIRNYYSPSDTLIHQEVSRDIMKDLAPGESLLKLNKKNVVKSIQNTKQNRTSVVSFKATNAFDSVVPSSAKKTNETLAANDAYSSYYEKDNAKEYYLVEDEDAAGKHFMVLHTYEGGYYTETFDIIDGRGAGVIMKNYYTPTHDLVNQEILRNSDTGFIKEEYLLLINSEGAVHTVSDIAENRARMVSFNEMDFFASVEPNYNHKDDNGMNTCR